MDDHVPRRELDVLAAPGQLVGAPSFDLDGRVHRRDLLERPHEPGQRLLDGLPIQGRPVDRGPLAVDVVRGRRGSEADRRPVALRAAEVVLDQTRGPAQEDGKHPRRERIQGPAVSHAARRRQAPDQPHHVVGGRT